VPLGLEWTSEDGGLALNEGYAGRDSRPMGAGASVNKRTDIDLDGRGPTLGEAFSEKHNSLNFLRLFLALAVIAAHAVGLGYFGKDWIGHGTTVATVAVYSFFGISGFLIARSAERNSFGRFLWQRFLRIAPGYWVCLLVTAFVFGVIGWSSGVHAHHGLAAYFRLRDGPIEFLTNNAYFKMRRLTIGKVTWNASTWTIFFEIVCYLIVGVMALLGLLRHRELILGLTAAAWIVLGLVVSIPNLNHQFGVLHWWDPLNFLTFIPVFMVGAVLYLYREEIPDSGALAVACVLVFTAGLWLPLGQRLPSFRLTTGNLLAPLLAYPMLWLGFHLPFRKVGARNDYSYGVYIYAYPVQQLLVIWHVTKHGYVAYALLSILGTVPLAVASWWLIEKRALALKKVDIHSVLRKTSAIAPSRPAPAKAWAEAKTVRRDKPAAGIPSGSVASPPL
jgi:peptidoglycan/LPS O-acetylase OafA/YrhL